MNVFLQNCYDATAKCFNITCEFFNLQPDEIIKVRFNSRLWNSSLTKDFHSNVDIVQIRSTGQLYIDPLAKVSQFNTKNDGTNVSRAYNAAMCCLGKFPYLYNQLIVIMMS